MSTRPREEFDVAFEIITEGDKANISAETEADAVR